MKLGEDGIGAAVLRVLIEAHKGIRIAGVHGAVTHPEGSAKLPGYVMPRLRCTVGLRIRVTADFEFKPSLWGW